MKILDLFLERAALATAMLVVSSVAASAGAERMVVRDVTVLTGDGSAPRAHLDVLVEGDRVRALAPTGSLDLGTGAKIRELDGSGGFLLPGFVDAHAHLTLGPVELRVSDGQPVMRVVADEEVTRRSRLSLLAHGVTSVRDPGGDTERAVALRNAIERGDLLGPTLRVAGRVIDHQPFEGLTDVAGSPEQVRAAVAAQVAAGVDMVKLYTSLSIDELAAGIAEADRQGVPAIAHLHQGATWTEAARAGLDGIVHIVPGSARLLPEAARDEYQSLLPNLQFYRWFEAADLDGPEVQEMIAALVEAGTTLDPTLVVFDAAFRGNLPDYRSSDHLELAAPSLVENWRSFFHFNIGWSAEDFERAQAVWPKVLELTRRLHEAGVPLTTGTDANNPWVVPGPSLHRELELLADAGIPPLEVLTLATRNGARVLGLEEETGTVAAGKRADLVLLAADPTRDIRATRQIVWVMKGGVLLEPAQLLAEIESGGTPSSAAR